MTCDCIVTEYHRSQVKEMEISLIFNIHLDFSTKKDARDHILKHRRSIDEGVRH